MNETPMNDDRDMKPSRLGLGKSLPKNDNPYRYGDDRALFLGQETAEEKERKRLAEQWDRDHPDGVE